MATIKANSILIALSVVLLCCLTVAAFAQQSSQPDKSSEPTTGHSTLPAKDSTDSQSKAIENGGVYKVGGSVLPPKVIHAPSPKYTNAARHAHREGDCILSLVVDTEGRPQNVQVIKPVGKGLDKSAIEAIKKYSFEPATLNGKPVPVEVDIDVRFRIYQR